MPGVKDSKLKTLYIYDILMNETDENNVISAAELCKRLENLGIMCERKSIYADIELLKRFGADIVYTRSNPRGYFIASRDFELAEIRLLIDAVHAAYFISAKKSGELIEKLGNLISEEQFKKLKNQVHLESRHKSRNEQIYYNIDLINIAIVNNKQISFKYSKHNSIAKDENNDNSRTFIVNPYALIWSNNQYYLVCNNPKYNNLMHTRLDRMKYVTVLKKKARHFSEVSEYTASFDSADYQNKVFNMFSGEKKKIKIKCLPEIADDIAERLGIDTYYFGKNKNYIIFETESIVSDGMVSWLMQFGEKLTVLEPVELRDAICEKAENIYKQYV